MAGAAQGGKGSQHGGEGTGKGTKRPAEAEAGTEGHPASALRLAPNAKRQKTDAEWGMVMLNSNVCSYRAVYVHKRHVTKLCTCLYTAYTAVYVQELSPNKVFHMRVSAS